MNKIWFRGFHIDHKGTDIIYLKDAIHYGIWVEGYYIAAEKLDSSGTEHFILPISKDEQSYGVLPETVSQLVYEREDIGKVFVGDIVETRVERHGGYSQWYSTKNKNHGTIFTLPMEVELYVNPWEYYFTTSQLTLTPKAKKLREELEKPMGKERTKQHINSCCGPKDIVKVLGNKWSNPEYFEE